MSEHQKEGISRNRAFAFPDSDSASAALDLVEEISKRHPVSYRPLGSSEYGDEMAVVSKETFRVLHPMLKERGIKFDIRRVYSIGELSREERATLRKTGKRIG